MTHYETVFILTPTLTGEQANEAAAKFRKVLTDAGCKIVHEESWGPNEKATGSPLQDKRWASFESGSTGYSRLFEFHDPGSSAVKELEACFRRDERVLRYRTVRLG